MPSYGLKRDFARSVNLIYSEIIFQRFIRFNIYENRTWSARGRWLTERKEVDDLLSGKPGKK